MRIKIVLLVILFFCLVSTFLSSTSFAENNSKGNTSTYFFQTETREPESPPVRPGNDSPDKTIERRISERPPRRPIPKNRRPVNPKPPEDNPPRDPAPPSPPPRRPGRNPGRRG